MKKENNKKTEDFLKDFSFKPAPSALKDKILINAQKKQKSNHVMTAFLWKGFVGCLFLLFIVIVVDATISHTQHKRFSLFLDIHQESSDKQEEEWSMLKDIIWEPLESTENEVKHRFYSSQEKSKINERNLEWRESLEKEFE